MERTFSEYVYLFSFSLFFWCVNGKYVFNYHSNYFSVPLVIKANDIDAGLNSHLHYDIVETMPRRYFHIDSTTGAIKTVMFLDHEKIPIFNFHVKVSKSRLIDAMQKIICTTKKL